VKKGDLRKFTKLTLNRETIVRLSDADLADVQGAQMKTSEGGGNCFTFADSCGW